MVRVKEDVEPAKKDEGVTQYVPSQLKMEGKQDPISKDVSEPEQEAPMQED